MTDKATSPTPERLNRTLSLSLQTWQTLRSLSRQERVPMSHIVDRAVQQYAEKQHEKGSTQNV